MYHAEVLTKKSSTRALGHQCAQLTEGNREDVKQRVQSTEKHSSLWNQL